ncbi:MAG: rhodanese-like domain-containing protein [Dehalococcoidia bacterium]|nr:MAG: rhodanese-like domain-containing protein [Dehalococcoidia bacterium]
MKIWFLGVIPFLLITVVVSISACGGVTGTTPTVQTITATTIPEPPSAEELGAQGFTLPELPRITCERLKLMMDNGESLIVVDTRIEFFFNMGHLPQSVVIPIQLEEGQAESLLALPKDRLIIFYCD